MSEDLARNRFFILSFVRLGGVLLAFLGVAIIAKRLIEPAEILGGTILLLGALEITVVPRILARRWRTPPQA